MLKKVFSAAVVGLQGELIEIETDISSGLPATIVVGLPDTAIRESRERVKSALKHSGCKFPRGRIAINLAPADVPKIGSHYDLPIAISMLASSGQLEFDPKGKIFLGELSLDGKIRPVSGVLVIAEFADRFGFNTIYVPEENALEASYFSKIKVVPVSDLSSLIRQLAGFSPEKHFRRSGNEEGRPDSDRHADWDFRLIRGQELAKRALEIAASGGHNVLMTGPPGSGKTMLARALATILPKMTPNESLEVTKIYSIAAMLPGKLGVVTSRPFRSPHHTSSAVSLVGGGSSPRPGEITLAHRGVLFLDEFPEFSRGVLESLRQPLEDGVINVARAARSVEFPAEFMLVAAQNPCPCGFSNDRERACVCTPSQLIRYQKKVSGPLLDRIDLHVDAPRLSVEKIEEESELEGSAAVRERVEKARQIQLHRFQKNNLPLYTNAEMGVGELKQFCRPEKAGLLLLRSAVSSQHLSVRAYHRVLKLARTIADIKQQEVIGSDEIAEALMFRPKESNMV